jgi:hypothetical protein
MAKQPKTKKFLASENFLELSIYSYNYWNRFLLRAKIALWKGRSQDTCVAFEIITDLRI